MITLTLHANATEKKLIPPALLKKISAYVSTALNFEKKSAEVTLAFVPAKTIQALNHDFRGKKKPTNVLSFPQFIPAELKKIKPAKKEILYLGDVILCSAVIRKEALTLKKTLNHHLTHLIVHGVLHLVGYDHMNAKEARRMETLEKSILAELGISDPYIIDAPQQKKKTK